jgi:hypothetical protein
MGAPYSCSRLRGTADYFQLKGRIHTGQNLIHSAHRIVLQLGVTALGALQNGQQANDHDRKVSYLERKIGDPAFLAASAR